MRPLMRLASRAAASPAASSQRFSLAIASRASPRPTSPRASTCLQCSYRQSIYTQRRGFASDNKSDVPPSTSSSASPSQSSIERDLENALVNELAKEQAARNENEVKGKQDSHQSKKTPTEEALNGEVIDELPSVEEGRQHQLTKRLNHLMDHLQSNIFIASQRINDLTGYSGIEELKDKIIKLEQQVAEAQEAVRAARLKYKTTVAERASSQREVTTLLARKDTWTAQDLERFTTLYRSDHTNEQAVQEASTKLSEAERFAEDRAMKLSSTILARYHEEQIWSDKIRRMSTWGTWGLMGVNVLLFLVFQLGFEPWRRKRLVKGFEEKVREALELERQMATADTATGREAVVGAVDAPAPIVATEAEIEPVKAKDEIENGVETTKATIQSEEDVSEKETSTVSVTISDDADPTEAAAAAATLAAPSSSSVETESTSARAISYPDPFSHDVAAALSKLRTREDVEDAIEDMWSERLVAIKKRDLTTVALEGVAAGATIATLIFSVILMRSN